MLVRIHNKTLPSLQRFAQNRALSVAAAVNMLLLSATEKEQIELGKEAKTPQGQARALLAAGAIPELVGGVMCVKLPDGRRFGVADL